MDIPGISKLFTFQLLCFVSFLSEAYGTATVHILVEQLNCCVTLTHKCRCIYNYTGAFISPCPLSGHSLVGSCQEVRGWGQGRTFLGGRTLLQAWMAAGSTQTLSCRTEVPVPTGCQYSPLLMLRGQMPPPSLQRSWVPVLMAIKAGEPPPRLQQRLVEHKVIRGVTLIKHPNPGLASHHLSQMSFPRSTAPTERGLNRCDSLGLSWGMSATLG